MGDNGWYVSDVEVTLSATDGGSGVESTWYKLDDSSWQEYTEGFTVSTDGLHTLLYNSTDKVGNTETTNEVELKIDQTPPVTTSVIDPSTPNGENGWYVTSVEVTLSATDGGSGVVSTWYKIDTGYMQLYSAPFTVEEVGEHIVLFYSIDSAGNQETEKSVTFKIDQTPPVTTSVIDPSTPNGENGWYVTSVEVTLSATDTTSGVDETRYKLNDGSWTTYTAPFTITDDEYTLEFYSVDYAGNEETVKSVNFKIDQTAPTIDLTVEKTGLVKWLLTATVSDETSGVAKVEFYLDDELLGEVTESPYEWEVSEKGTAYAVVYDNAGNEASDEVAVSYSQSQSQSNSNLVPVQRRISLILGGLTGI